MNGLMTFWNWLTRGGGKPDKAPFKNDKEAAEFVRRVYNANPGPNQKLRRLHQEYSEINNGRSKKSDRPSAA